MFMRVWVSIIIIGFFNFKIAAGQDFSGLWEGILYQEGKTDTFSYTVKINQSGTALSGTSFSVSPDEHADASFAISGVISNQTIILQEIQQNHPASPKWCLKYMTLRFEKRPDGSWLLGDWQAEGCVPGKIRLKKEGTGQAVRKALVTEEVPFSLKGKWTGFLSQTDRTYGFYYEFNLGPSDGQSYIVSEGNGGSAKHQLTWTFNERDSMLHIEELNILEKSDGDWRWCIKNADLKLSRSAHTDQLSGNWSGYIEGYNMETGPCASGQLFLEKPVQTKQVNQSTEALQKPYEESNARKVKVQRVIEVKSPKLKIRVWDNGTVDGDVATIILNGQILFENYRVTKTRYARLVTLQAENNLMVLHAEDLGDIAPNTVAVSIDDGVKEQVLIVSSNLEESGAVLIKQFNVN